MADVDGMRCLAGCGVREDRRVIIPCGNTVSPLLLDDSLELRYLFTQSSQQYV